MKNIFKNEKGSLPAGKQGGFVELIIIIIIALLVMRYFGVTISGAIDWIIALFRSVFR